MKKIVSLIADALMALGILIASDFLLGDKSSSYPIIYNMEVMVRIALYLGIFGYLALCSVLLDSILEME